MPQLGVWLRRQHVARWWGDPDHALAAIREHSPTTQALIAVDDRPVGYLCWQKPEPEELAAAGLNGLPADLIDVDILIGEPDLIGLGVGPRALSLLLERLRAEGVSSVGMATAADNRIALRAYEKVGFQRFQVFHEAGQEMCYLVRTLEPAG
ncbi:MAG: GNAT family N-acetyltransferase [Gemmatimonadota bacterium]|nr:MAG: GNAT family N-acetyltransferase [Gemmatimonadota bacterium]